jgi:uncharacterized protein (TIGR02598 family)
MRRQFPRAAPRHAGFSLVETAVAIGVIAVAMTTVLGTWPGGQSMLRSAGDATITAQIAQRVAAEVRQTDFPEMLRIAGVDGPAPTGTLPRRYFSQTGREVALDDPSRAYEVLARVSHTGQFPMQSAGNARRWDSQGNIVLAIEIVVAPAGVQAPVGASGLVDRTKFRRPVHSYPFFVGGNAAW